jgi:hypothetical protein
VARSRRNQITRGDAQLVAGVAALSGVVANLAGCEPTGETVPDVVLTFGLAALVTWLAASAPWWALCVAAAITGAAAAAGGPWLLMLVAWVALLTAAAVGYLRFNQPVVRAGCAALVVQVALRADWNPRFLASAAVAAVALGLLAIAGWQRRQRHVRRRVMWGALAALVVGGLAVAGLAVSAGRVGSSAQTGYHAMLEALDHMKSGNLTEADAALDEAAAALDRAGDGFDGPLAQPSRIVPGVAQNRAVAADLANRSAAAARAAGAALDSVDLDRLQVVDGKIDVLAMGDLEAPLAELEATVLDLREVLTEVDEPWLVGPLESRLESVRDDADQAAVQAVGSHAAARVGPAMLGADGPRRYLIAFTNPAEARGLSGLMGEWNEMTVSGGRIELTGSGSTSDLERGIDNAEPIHLDMAHEYFARYGWMGAGGAAGDPVDRKFWVNSMVSPDLPTVGEVYAQLYEAATGTRLDGVIVIDPTAIAGMLSVTGPVELTAVDARISADNAVEFLTLGQYEYPENVREEVVAELTAKTLDAVLSTTLPPPQRLGAALGPAATEGHLSVWAARPEEQRLLELVGIEAAMPRLAEATPTDALAVTVNNAGGNKIDSFLETRIEYRPHVDGGTGVVTAELEITLTNTAPSTGYSEYVIGNVVDLPDGTNRAMVEIWSALELRALAVDGVDWGSSSLPDLGWNVGGVNVDIPPGATTTITAELQGQVTNPADYQLVVRPQPLPNPAVVRVEAEIERGADWEFEGELLRRSVVSADGVTAWRPADHPAA